MTEQIRDILTNFDHSSSAEDKLGYAFEVSTMMLQLNQLKDIDFNKLYYQNQITDTILGLDEIVQYTIEFLEFALDYLDDDLKDSDFEKGIQDNKQTIQHLFSQYDKKNKQLEELASKNQEINATQVQIKKLDEAIAEYIQIDLEEIRHEKELRVSQLNTLDTTMANEMQIYKTHLEENRKIKISNHKLDNLQQQAKDILEEMDSIYKDTIIEKEKLQESIKELQGG